MAEINWTEDSLEELLEKSIGDIREMLAHEDADIDFKTFLVENGWIETDDYEDDDYDDEDDYEEDEDSEEDEDWDDDEDTPSNLSEEEEALAYSIASDINSGNYTLDTIRAFYNSEVIDRVEELLD